MAEQAGVAVSSGPSGKHRTPRRSVASEHWAQLDEVAEQDDTTAVEIIRGLIHATLTDTEAAIATCKRIRKVVTDG